MTLSVAGESAAPISGTVAFDFDVPLLFGKPYWIFFENLSIESQDGLDVRVFAAGELDSMIDQNATMFSTTVALAVRWRDGGGPRGIYPVGTWQGQLDLPTRALVMDVNGVDATDSSHTFSMHIEAMVDNLPPIADAGGDVTLACTSPNGTPVTLDATLSHDPDVGDTIARVQWYEAGMPASHDPTTTVTLPVGKTSFELHVYDQDLAAGYQMKNVTVTSSAQCP